MNNHSSSEGFKPTLPSVQKLREDYRHLFRGGFKSMGSILAIFGLAVIALLGAATWAGNYSELMRGVAGTIAFGSVGVAAMCGFAFLGPVLMRIILPCLSFAFEIPKAIGMLGQLIISTCINTCTNLEFYPKEEGMVSTLPEGDSNYEP